MKIFYVNMTKSYEQAVCNVYCREIWEVALCNLGIQNNNAKVCLTRNQTRNKSGDPTHDFATYSSSIQYFYKCLIHIVHCCILSKSIYNRVSFGSTKKGAFPCSKCARWQVYYCEFYFKAAQRKGGLCFSRMWLCYKCIRYKVVKIWVKWVFL